MRTEGKDKRREGKKLQQKQLLEQGFGVRLCGALYGLFVVTPNFNVNQNKKNHVAK